MAWMVLDGGKLSISPNPGEVGVQKSCPPLSLISSETGRNRYRNHGSRLSGGAGFLQGGLAWNLSNPGGIA